MTIPYVTNELTKIVEDINASFDVANADIVALGGGGGEAEWLTVPAHTRALLPIPSPLNPGSLARVTDEGNRLVINTGSDWTPLLNDLNVQWFGASGARSSTPIPIWFTSVAGTASAGATSITVNSSSSFAQFGTVKITGAGPGGGVYRGIITNTAGTTWTLYPALHTTTTNASIHHGDNNVTTRTSSSVLASATIIPVVDSATFRTGHDVYIAGSGAVSGGSKLHEIRTILSVAGNNITLTSGITNAISANALVMHDETRAFNAAVAVAALLRTAEINAPAGTFMVNGPASGTSLGRIQMPSSYDISNPLTIRLKGAPRTIPTFPAFIANHGVTTNGTIIQSDGVGGSIVAGDASGSFTVVDGQFEDITFRTYDNPKICGVDGRLLVFMRLENCMFDTGSQSAAVTQPTDTTNFAFATGLTGNGGQEVIRNVWSIGGWYSGMDLHEHAVIEGDVTSFGNYYGARLDSAVHPIFIGRLAVHECTRTIGVFSLLRFKIGALVLERRWPLSPLPAWLDTEWDIYDPNSFGSGEVAYHITEGYTNAAKSFLVNGALDLTHYPLSTGKVTNRGIPFSDNFEDNSIEESWWAIGSQAGVDGSPRGTVVEQNQRLEIAPQASVGGIRYRGYVTKDTFNLFGKAVTVKVPQVTSNGASTVLIVQLNLENKYAITVNGTDIVFYYVYRNTPVGVAIATYNAVNHLWWRIRESANYVVTAEVSSDGAAWTLLGEDTGARMFFNQMRISLEAGTESSIAVPGTAFFDSFSIQ